MTTTTINLLAAASAAQAAALDLIEAARDGKIHAVGNVASGETTIVLAESLRLLLQALPDFGEDETQLLGAVERYLDENR